MIELITLFFFLPIGVIVAFKSGKWKKIPSLDFILITSLWFFTCLLIDLFATERALFYSNDQETFVKAAISLKSCISNTCGEIDFRYLTQSIPALFFISIGLEPLNSLKGINYLCWILLYRLYLSYNHKKSLGSAIPNKYLKFIFLGPTILLFSVIGNRDVIVILLFGIFTTSLLNNKNFRCLLIIMLMLSLRFQAGFLLALIFVLYSTVTFKRYSFIKTIVLALIIIASVYLVGSSILGMITELYGFNDFDISSGINVNSILFSILNLFGLGFIFSNSDTSSNSIATLLLARVVFFDTFIYTIFSIFFIILPKRRYLDDKPIINAKIFIIAIFLVYSLISFSLNFFSTRQNLPFFYTLVLLHLMSRPAERVS